MHETIDVTVAAVVERNDRFLIVEEIVAGRRVFNQPAGHVEPYESLEEAVVREVLEESGYRFHPSEVLGTYLWRDPTTSRRFLRVAFTGTVLDPGVGVELDEGIVQVHWLTYRELLDREPRARTPMVLRSIEDYVRGMAYPLASLSHIQSGSIEVQDLLSVIG
jgi:NADH pyrophosphatase NudC (nudix superfamily)